MITIFRSAFADIAAGLRLRRVWVALAAEDIGDQHRRTSLGPLWILVNYLLFAGTFIVIFRRNMGAENYPAYVATGLFVWLFITDAISQGIALLRREESFIKGTTLPISIYVMKLTMQSVIRAGYALIGCLAILFLSGTGINPGWWWSGLGLLLIVAVAPATIVVFGIVGVLVPDMQFVVSNVMRLGMFLTPIFWTETGGNAIRTLFYYWNPFTHFLEIVRLPILTGEVAVNSFLICLVLSIAMWLAALVLLGTYRKQLVFLL